jgi:prefoldin subunit 5
MTSKSPLRSCEDVDETSLSYAEIKALCAGNPLIKEKMDLDVDVARLKLLKADFQNHKYKLEDRLLKYYPERIRKYEQYIQAVTADLAMLNAHPLVQGEFAATIKNMHFTKRTDAGGALLAVCNDFLSGVAVEVGNYRGFGLHLYFDQLLQEFKVVIQGATKREITLGSDASGNMVRIENALDNLPKELTAAQNKLDTLYQQVENAKIELTKSFSQEELQIKSARLVELNTELDIDKGVSQPPIMADEEQEAADEEPQAA